MTATPAARAWPRSGPRPFEAQVTVKFTGRLDSDSAQPESLRVGDSESPGRLGNRRGGPGLTRGSFKFAALTSTGTQASESLALALSCRWQPDSEAGSDAVRVGVFPAGPGPALL